LDFQSIVLPWSIVVSNSLGLLIEPPLLLLDIVSPSLEPHVSVTVHLSNSVEWKLRDKIEWSIDVEAEFFIESLGLKLSGLIKIEYLPLLVFSSVITPNSNCLSFNILSSFNIKNLVVIPVEELAILILEDLEPS
jgi:hypothetical protein